MSTNRKEIKLTEDEHLLLKAYYDDWQDAYTREKFHYNQLHDLKRRIREKYGIKDIGYVNIAKGTIQSIGNDRED